jgi:hypothetical protein
LDRIRRFFQRAQPSNPLHPPLPEPVDAWPSTTLAYEFVRPSYDVVLKRLETVELRIRAILTLAATLTLAAPVFIPSFAGKREPLSVWFVGALVVFAVIGWWGLGPRSRGHVKIISPRFLYERTLHLPQRDFMSLALKTAGEDFDANMALVNHHGVLADRMGILLIGEAALLVCWAFLPNTREQLQSYFSLASESLCSMPLPPSLISTLMTICGVGGGPGNGGAGDVAGVVVAARLGMVALPSGMWSVFG